MLSVSSPDKSVKDKSPVTLMSPLRVWLEALPCVVTDISPVTLTVLLESIEVAPSRTPVSAWLVQVLVFSIDSEPAIKWAVPPAVTLAPSIVNAAVPACD